MKIATIDSESGSLVIGDQEAPSDGAKVLAAAINPMDRIVAKGVFGFRPFSPGQALGYSGVAEDKDGKRYYFWDPKQPAGSLSEFVDLTATPKVELPEGLDPAIGAVVGVPGVAAVASLDAGGVTAGTTVAVLGVSGTVGLIAAVVAQARGANVIGIARDTAANRELLGGYDFRTVFSDSPDDPALLEALTAFSPDGIDAVIDPLWGNYPTHLLASLGVGGRWVHLGSSAGNESTVLASSFRNVAASIVGLSIFRLTGEQIASSYQEAAKIAGKQAFNLPFTPTPLDELPEAWKKLENGTITGKIIVVP